MSSKTISENKYFLAALLVGAAFMLVGGGCSSSEGDSTAGGDTVLLASKSVAVGDSSIAGENAAAVEADMDALVGSYTDFLEETGLASLTGPDEDGYDLWRISDKSDGQPTVDPWNNAYYLTVIDGGIQMWSWGADREPGTGDDPFKNYAY